MIEQEQIVRIARTFGNGAHVFVPKEWAGEEIIIVKPQRKSLKERILSELEPYLNSIAGVYLYGSYARGEQQETSDIDLFVITHEKIKIKAEGFEVVSLREEDMEKAIKLEPVLLYSILSEAKPIINSRLLETLKSKYKPKRREFDDFTRDSKGMIKVSEETLLSEKEYLSSEAVIYSLILRLRGLFIIKSLLSGKQYSHKLFKQWIKENLPEIEFSKIYDAYRSAKNEKKFKEKIKTSNVHKLLEFLKNELLLV